MSKFEKSFVGGNPLKAEELNQMAAAINDNDDRIASLREDTDTKLTELEREIKTYTSSVYDSNKHHTYISSQNRWDYSTNSDCVTIPIKEGDVISIRGTKCQWTLLSSIDNINDSRMPQYMNGYSLNTNVQAVDVTSPSNGYLYIIDNYGGTDFEFKPTSLTINGKNAYVSDKEQIDVIYTEVKEISALMDSNEVITPSVIQNKDMYITTDNVTIGSFYNIFGTGSSLKGYYWGYILLNAGDVVKFSNLSSSGHQTKVIVLDATCKILNTIDNTTANGKSYSFSTNTILVICGTYAYDTLELATITRAKKEPTGSNILSLISKAIFIGDSVTQGYVVDPANGINGIVYSNLSYPSQLKKLHPGLEIVNAGRSGSKASEWASSYMSQYNYADCQLCIIELGWNEDISSAISADNPYCAIIEYVKSQNPSMVIVLVCSKGWGVSQPYKASTLEAVRAIGEHYDVPVIDMNDWVKYPFKFNNGDDVHSDAYGYLVKAEYMSSAINEALERYKAKTITASYGL